jgi:hypothetical protein
MAITSAICNSFKQELLVEGHNFTGGTDQFKLALFTENATLSKSTTAYTAPTDPAADPTSTNEVSTTSTGYSAGGNNLTSTTPVLSGDTACCKFADTSFTSASFTARGCLIYNSTNSNKAVCAINFGANKTVTSGTFTIQFPAQTAGNAIIQIA